MCDSYFDRLPDELVAIIVEKLSGWKAKARTSILSRRFHRIWVSFILCKKDLILNHGDHDNEGWITTPKFVEFVSHMLRMFKGSKVDSLEIDVWWLFFVKQDFVVFEKLMGDFEHWLAFARDKSVQSLKVYLPLTKMTCSFPIIRTFKGFDKLTSLSLKFVKIDDDVLEQGLKTYLVNLESLFIGGVDHRSLVIVSPKLKKLEIREPYYFCKIDIHSASNLECLKLSIFSRSAHVSLCFKHTMSKLTHVSIDGRYSLCKNHLLELQKVSSVLEKLEPNPPDFQCLKEVKFPGWRGLKHEEAEFYFKQIAPNLEKLSHEPFRFLD